MEKKCPFSQFKKECGPHCALFMEVVRCYDDGGEAIVKGCVFILDHDERRNQTQRLAMMQNEAGELKQISLFSSAVQLQDNQTAAIELGRIFRKNVKALPEGNGDAV